MRRPLMPCTVMPLKIMSSEKFTEMGFEVSPRREILPPRRTMSKAVRIESGWPAISRTTSTPTPPVFSNTMAGGVSFRGIEHIVGFHLARDLAAVFVHFNGKHGGRAHCARHGNGEQTDGPAARD